MIDFTQLKVVQLKEELTQRGLSTQGLKAELISRLQAFEASSSSGQDAIQTESSDSPRPTRTRSKRLESTPSPEKKNESQVDLESTQTGSPKKATLPSPSQPTSSTKAVESAAKVPSSPTKVVESSAKVASSPIKAPSPTKAVESPAKVPSSKAVNSPTKVPSSPTKAVESPAKVASSPAKSVNSSTKVPSSPKKEVESSAKAPSPTKEVNSPTKAPSSPTKAVESPAKVASPTKAVNSSTKAPSSPSKPASPKKTTTNPDTSLKRKLDQPDDSSKKPKIQAMIFIQNLTRPLRVQDLETLVQEYGRVENVWVDSIKSKAIITYQTQEEAVVAKEKLHGITYPSHNKQTLDVSMISIESAQEIKEKEGDKRSQVRDARNAAIFQRALAFTPAGQASKRSSTTESMGQPLSASTDREPVSAVSERAPLSATSEISLIRSVQVDPNYHIPPLPPAVPVDELFKKTVAKPSLYYKPNK